MNGPSVETCVQALASWYDEVHRDLPWRSSDDPYSVWISETMLQQTTSTAVIPFFLNFMKRFPTLQSLATSEIDSVYEAWAGLGYYSRARNLHKAAKELVELGDFPESYEELIKLPGFGPYTARAVSSLSFREPVGVVDGNTIRVFSRIYQLDIQWWKPAGRQVVQDCADYWVSYGDPAVVNQALMELGATVCRPQNPSCLLCPVSQACLAHRTGDPARYPNAKPKRPRELWHWRPQIIRKNGKVLFVKNTTAPFLKNQWLLPGKAGRTELKPKSFDFQHSITHHDIFVTIEKPSSKVETSCFSKEECIWVSEDSISKVVPLSLIKKVFSTGR